MKTTILHLSLWLTFGLTLTGCFVDDIGIGCPRATGEYETQTLQVPNFDGIKLTMDARVEITQGDELSVTVEGKSDVIDELSLDVDDGTWRIDTYDCMRNIDNLTIYITMPYLRKLTVSGSGEIYSTNTLVGDDVDLTVSGSGKIDVALTADDIDALISGSGEILAEGTGDELDLDISGSGDFFAFGLAMRRADIRISGSGTAEVRVEQYLKARISGSGDVYYKGNPDLDVSVSGSGRVIDAN